MSRSVVLSLGSGSLTTGFATVVVEVYEPTHARSLKLHTSLPPAPDLLLLYRQWQVFHKNYHQRYRRGIQILEEADVTNFSELDFEQVCRQLPDRLNAWLDCEEFRGVDRQLCTQFNPQEEIHVTIETDDELARRLPWCLWRFFADFPQAEVELSNPDYQRALLNPTTATAGVKILVILGDSTGIDVEKDCKAIRAIPGANSEFLVQPKAMELSDRLWAKGWDILFFAGHSSSQDGTGRIYLNATESLTIAELRPALRTAIANGLKLAIFNSCDGLKLAEDLADLHIPATIVMREPVPDRVAQAFLQYFLPAFAKGASLHRAFRQVREQLHIWQREFPCASWLPTLTRNPAEEPPTWEGLLHKDQTPRRSFWFKACCLLVCSVVVSGSVVQVRRSGALQTIEQKAYDHLTRLQVTTPVPDDRILVVRIDPKELTPLQRSDDGRLNDQTLAELLQKLRQYQPELIGLDIYRDRSIGSGEPKLIQQSKAKLIQEFKATPQLMVVCKSSDKDELTREGYTPAEGVQSENIGLSDSKPDTDEVIRRHLIQMKPEDDSLCRSQYALSAVLSFKYLAARKIMPSGKGFLQLGSNEFRKLQAPTGIYQQADTGGYQILLRYRPYRKLTDISPSVTLAQVLKDDVKSNKFQDKIVLVGYDDDRHLTPYALEDFPDRKTPGVFIHAQMVSQMISAALDDRSLLQFLPVWADNLWIWSWAMIGGVLVWQWHSSRSRLIAIGASSSVLCLICWGCLIQGFWIPLVPSALALLATSELTMLVFKFQRRNRFVLSTPKTV